MCLCLCVRASHFFMVLGLDATVQQPQKEKTVMWSFLLTVSTDVHPDGHVDCLHVPQRLCVPWDALHAQGLCHHLPAWAERSEEETKLQGARVAHGRLYEAGSAFWLAPALKLCCVVAGCRPGRQNVPEIQRKAERRDKDRTWQVAVRFHIYQVLMLLTVSPLAWSRIASSTGSDFFAPSP